MQTMNRIANDKAIAAQERDDRALALLEAGIDRDAIAARLGIPRRKLSDHLNRAKKRRENVHA